jgi:predicted Zn-dependent peptidase
MIAFVSQVIEARLRSVITRAMKQSHGIDVSYEFPLYPKLDCSWISIRFRSEAKDVTKLKKLILKELELLISQGPTEAEVEYIRKLEFGNDEFWMKDNFYLASMLTNYYLWGWSPDAIYKDALKIQTLTVEEIHSFLQKSITMGNYTVIMANP